MPLLTASQLKVDYGELEVFSGVDLEVAEGARVGIVGPNGGGKTTLLRVLVGEIEPDGGAVHRSRGLRTGYVPQTPSPASAGSLKDEVMTAFAAVRRVEDALAASAMEIQRAGATDLRQAERRYASLLQEHEALGGYDYESRMERVVDGVGLTPKVLETPVAAASGGERTRAALARALLAEPDLLVLDEPTNYLDFKGLAWLEGFLDRFANAFVVVSHDRYFLDRVVNRIWDLDRGRLRSFDGSYTKYAALKAEQTRRQQVEFERQQEYIAKEESFIQRYAAGQRSREARGRATRLARLERIEEVTKEKTVHIGGPGASRTGQIAVSTHGLTVGFTEGGRHVPLLSVPNLTLERASRTALIGGNGIGKTTLLRTILGHVPPLEGTVSLGHNVRTGYQRQGNDDIRDGPNVLDSLLEIKNIPIGEARSYLARFLFQGDDVFQAVASLSGGERTRLALARLLMTATNVLVLDEPTTHLDIPSREALEQVLLDYDGTLLFVSHDRRLISMLARQLWVIEDGTVRHFEGTFEEWAAETQDPSLARAVKPRKPPAKRRPPAAKTRPHAPAGPPPPDPEQVIAELEARLATIERELQAASERQDVGEVERLGKEYDKTQTRVEHAWRAWGN